MGAQRQKQALITRPPIDYTSSCFLPFLILCPFFFFFFFYPSPHFPVYKCRIKLPHPPAVGRFPNRGVIFIIGPQEPVSEPNSPVRKKAPNLALHQREPPPTEATSLNFFVTWFLPKLLCTICFSLTISPLRLTFTSPLWSGGATPCLLGYKRQVRIPVNRRVGGWGVGGDSRLLVENDAPSCLGGALWQQWIIPTCGAWYMGFN